MKDNMVTSFASFKYFIRKDMASQGRANFTKDFLFSAVFRFTVLLRFNEYLLNDRKPMLLRIIPYLWYKRLGLKVGYSIPFNVFDYGLGLVHYGLVIVNPDARIGTNCRIHAGVNIGGSAGFKSQGDTNFYAPVIGNNCYIGPGAKLFGSIKIGNDCVIGANAVVNKSFENNEVTIAGVPAKIISDKGSKGLVPKI